MNDITRYVLREFTPRPSELAEAAAQRLKRDAARALRRYRRLQRRGLADTRTDDADGHARIDDEAKTDADDQAKMDADEAKTDADDQAKMDADRASSD